MKIKIKKDLIYYPEIENENFYKDIYFKKEFYDNRIKKETRSYNEICNSTSKKLFPHQKFLKNYISIDTPYNGVLMFHGTGVVGWTIAGFLSKDKAILTNFGLQIPLF